MSSINSLSTCLYITYYLPASGGFWCFFFLLYFEDLRMKKERINIFLWNLIHSLIMCRAARLPSNDGNSVKRKCFFCQRISVKLPYIVLSITGHSTLRYRHRKNVFIKMRKSQVREVWKPIRNESFSLLIKLIWRSPHNDNVCSVRSATCASTLNEDPSRVSDFRDIAELDLSDSARLSQIPRSSLSHSPRPSPAL